MKYDLDPDTRAVLAAVIAGEDVKIECLYEPGLWRPVISNLIEKKLRLKPRTIRIGEYDVLEPMRADPESGRKYYTPNIVEPDYSGLNSWVGNAVDFNRLAAGVCHATEAAAITHGKALRSLTEMKP